MNTIYLLLTLNIVCLAIYAIVAIFVKKYRAVMGFLIAALSLILSLRCARITQKTHKQFCWQGRTWVFNHKKQTSYVNAKKICICTFSTPDINDYAKITKKVNQDYCKLHGYSFVSFHDRQSSRDPRWDKVQIIKDLLEKKELNGDICYDYVFWIDADAYFNKPEISIQEFVYCDKSVIICDDPLTFGANTGTILIKNSKWSREFLKLWWQNGEKSKLAYDQFHEQDVLDIMYKSDFYGLSKEMLILNASAFNSDHRITKKYLQGWDETFVVHLMGKKNNERVKVLSKLFSKQVPTSN